MCKRLSKNNKRPAITCKAIPYSHHYMFQPNTQSMDIHFNHQYQHGKSREVRTPIHLPLQYVFTCFTCRDHTNFALCGGEAVDMKITLHESSV